MTKEVKSDEKDEKISVDETTENESEEVEDEEVDEESQETEGEESEDSKPEEKEKVERPEYTMPVSKAQDEKRRAVEKAKEEAKQEAEAEMDRLRAEYEAKLTSQSGDDSYVKELEKVATEHGLEPKAAEALLNVFKKSIKLPDTSKYDKILKEQEEAQHRAKTSSEFDEKVLPLIQKDYPSVTVEHIQKVKDEIINLAHSKGYNTYQLEDIYTVRKNDFVFKSGFSAEGAGGHSNELVSFEKMTDKEEHELSERDPEGYKKYLTHMRSKGSRYLD